MIRRLIILALLIWGCDEAGLNTDSLTSGTTVTDTLYIPYDTTYTVYDTLIVNDNIAIRAGFSPLWQLYMDSSEGGWQNNDNGRFSWDDTYAIDGLIRLFNSTSDVFYLDLAIGIMNKFYDNTDEKRGIQDVYRDNQSVSVWSSTRYTEGNYHAFNCHIGFIVYAGTKVADAMMSGYLPISYNVQAEELIAKLEESFSYIEDTWVNDGEGGYFEEPYFKDINISTPLNMISLCGMATLGLYNLTGKSILLDYTAKMAWYIKQHLYLSNETYIWPYKPPLVINEDGSIIGPDDNSHGAIVTWFCVQAYENDIVFNVEDMTYFSNTFLNNIYVGTNQFRKYVDPKRDPMIFVDTVLFIYMILDSEDVKQILLDHYETRLLIYDSSSFLNHFGTKLMQAYSFAVIEDWGNYEVNVSNGFQVESYSIIGERNIIINEEIK